MASPQLDDQALPETLRDWRYTSKPVPHHYDGRHQRPAWDPLFAFFKEHGFHLFDYADFRRFCPPDERVRQPDAWVHCTLAQVEKTSRFITLSWTGNMCPARTTDGRDVLIRVVAQGLDGHEHLAALRRIASGPHPMSAENHCVPVLRELTTGATTFAVFPLMADSFDNPYFFNWNQALDCIEQLTEGVKFFHENLVAHLDLAGNNILINCRPGRRVFVGPNETRSQCKYQNFRSTFPVRYYWNDFELAACFDAASDPATRTIVGLPTKRVQVHGEGEYGRTPAPESLEVAPYCPFKADIWMLGQFFNEYFGNLRYLSPEFFALVDKMRDKNPAHRPSADVVLNMARHVRRQASTELLETKL